MALADHARAWLAQRQLGAIEVAAVEASELREMSDATARAQSEALLELAATKPYPPERVTTSGFVEQQRLFARARRR